MALVVAAVSILASCGCQGESSGGGSGSSSRGGGGGGSGGGGGGGGGYSPPLGTAEPACTNLSDYLETSARCGDR